MSIKILLLTLLDLLDTFRFFYDNYTVRKMYSMYIVVVLLLRLKLLGCTAEKLIKSSQRLVSEVSDVSGET